MWKCKYCEKQFDFLNPLETANHSRWCYKNPKRVEYVKKFKECINRNVPSKFKGSKISEERKLKISKSMKKVHAEGNHPGWSHVNSNIERRSYLEKVFYESINIHKLNEKYTIVEKFSVNGYYLDFAILEMKIDIEVDGQQHFADQKAIDHDKKRDETLKKDGWKIYRISGKEIQNDVNLVMKDLLSWLTNAHNQQDRFYNVEEIKKLYSKKYQKLSEKEFEELCVKKRKFHIEKEELEKLVKIKSMIEIGKMYGVSSNAIKKRCKRYGIHIEKYHWQTNIPR